MQQHLRANLRIFKQIGEHLTTKNTPAVTIVAACIKAETGVGPSMASGNQVCNKNCADFTHSSNE